MGVVYRSMVRGAGGCFIAGPHDSMDDAHILICWKENKHDE
jgi:hypothetical protein